MKEWKEEVIEEMEKLAEDLKEVPIKDAAYALGIKHIKTEDCKDILLAFCKRHPEYRPVKMMRHSYDSLFEAGVATMCQYDKAEDYDE